MSDGLIGAAVVLIAGLIAIIKPIINLNTNITELTSAVKQLKELINDKTDKLDKRVTRHGEEIDEIKLKQTEHETRISQLEK